MRREHDIMIETPVLPSEYSRLNYIECSGTQYFNTGVKPNPNFKWYYVFQWLDLNSDDSNFNGCEDWSSTSTDIIIRIAQRPDGNRGTSIVYGDLGNFASYIAFDYPNTSKTTFYLENGHQYVDDVEVSQGVITKSSDCNIFFFANDGGKHSPYHYCKQARMYYSWMKFGDILVREFIPALRVSDSKPGLYDTVNSVFYTNAGSGEFLYA